MTGPKKCNFREIWYSPPLLCNTIFKRVKLRKTIFKRIMLSKTIFKRVMLRKTESEAT